MKRPFFVSAVLTAIAIGFRNPANAYIADKVLPRRPVSAEKFSWTEYPLKEAFQVPDAEVGRTGRVQQLEFGGDEKTSETKDYGLDSPIPNSDINAAREARDRKVSTFDPEGTATELLTDTLTNIREVRVAQIIQNPANYSAGRKVTLAGGDQFSDYANSDPIAVLKEGMNKTLVYRPNTLSMGRSVWSYLSSHPKVVEAVKGVTDKGIISIEEFLNLFRDQGLKEVLVGDAFYDVAKPGKAANLQGAWGNHISLIYKNPVATPEGGGVTFGFTAEYGNRIAGRIQDDDIGMEGGVRIRVGEKIKEEICARDVGYLIRDAVAG
ncbi:MAG: hypothetical protein ACK5NN_00230 [Sphingomonadaceae bacterium]